MNTKTVVVLLLLTFVILVVVPESFARPQYLANLSAVYGKGSCGTCHVIASGAALIAIGQPPIAGAPADIPQTGTGIQAAPGFEILVSLIGLFAWSLLARRHNR